MNPDDVLDRFANVRQAGSGWTARCPAHDDQRNSLTIDRGGGGRWLLKCHANCPFDAILDAAGLTTADVGPDHTSSSGGFGHVDAVYPYRDERGTLLYEACRLAPKDFRARAPDGTWSIKDCRRVLYRLNELQQQPTVAIVEGEKDADRLWSIGYPTTTNVFGAGKWRDDYTRQLITAGCRRVVVFPDNDPPGSTHGRDVARACHDAGITVKLILLPDLPPKGDVSNYLDTHTRADLDAIVAHAPLFDPAGVVTPPPMRPFADILDALRAFLRRYVVLTGEQADVIALWIAHTHTLDAFDCTPYLQITSATKRSGKTRLLEVLDQLVARPWLTGRVSGAVLARKIDDQHSTLLLDESDAAFKGEKEYAEALRGLLNTGYRRSGRSSLCVGQGNKITYRDFSTFSAKAIAGIGDLPDTVEDRAIPIALKRRTKDEPCDRWRTRDGQSEASPLREAVAAWANTDDFVATLRDARPTLPDRLSDRQMDVWEPLFAIADLAGAAWATRARVAATRLVGDDDDHDITVELLRDLADILDDDDTDHTVIPTRELLEHLTSRDDRPWATWRHDKPMTPRSLAKVLANFGIKPTATNGIRGYFRDAFDEAFARYLPFKPHSRTDANKSGPELPFSNRTEGKGECRSKLPFSPIDTDLGCGSAVRNRGNGERDSQVNPTDSTFQFDGDPFGRPDPGERSGTSAPATLPVSSGTPDPATAPGPDAGKDEDDGRF
jgi:Protein of unknown function (DUF3631)